MISGNGNVWCFLARYLIPSLDRANAGHYRCIVRNRVGAIMQCSTAVQVACELTLCSPRRRVFVKKVEPERTDGGLAVI